MPQIDYLLTFKNNFKSFQHFSKRLDLIIFIFWAYFQTFIDHFNWKRIDYFDRTRIVRTLLITCQRESLFSPDFYFSLSNFENWVKNPTTQMISYYFYFFTLSFESSVFIVFENYFKLKKVFPNFFNELDPNKQFDYQKNFLLFQDSELITLFHQ